MGAELVHPLKLVSLLLQHPEAELVEALSGLSLDEVGPAGRKQRQRFAAFLEWWERQPLGELQRDYVERFELSKRCALHLTYHLHGDSRQRGLALLRLRQAYAEAGWDADPVELPDFLPLMLEFAALEGAGLELLERNREAIELVAAALRDERSAYAELLGVVTDSLGGLSARQVNRIRRLAAEGPPSEEVGLEPFAPPEVVPR
jgi:nitrate reductase molybdenum cofactor assembly chaperone NarJ/NarW